MTHLARCCNNVSNPNLSPNLKGAPVKHTDMKKDKAAMQKAVNKHEGRLHKGATPTKLAKGGVAMKAAGGMAMKGKGVAKRGCN
jgi:hypothetical protein